MLRATNPIAEGINKGSLARFCTHPRVVLNGKFLVKPKIKPSSAPYAIVADRDGTLIEHVDYVSDPSQIRLIVGVKESIHAILKAGIPFFIFTNQSGVGRGYFSIEEVHAAGA